jgi:death-on-curing protein
VKRPRWVHVRVLLLLHAETLAEHGGLSGVRDVAGMESALARPQNLYAYGRADLAGLAAAYAFGIIRNHPFSDGNKRAGFLAAGLFLALNGFELVSDTVEAAQIIMGVATGKVSEKILADWIRIHLARQE